ncbi:hypothetical protein GE21DRAFT_5586 [Neurospora crassa]|uniref:Uncharacterized protein n=1 Tax=Neurospora crassa (strain ATCC 24698 / 74-OR23-1A / CBS 708.71 / DSM 1257 / FGSC 987) TaxID=367110 RepID=V5IN60_NEUCR|nr:hypothetical protein NCU16765 [Neurospora crassa OR74A]ESA42820.1 hypothetical protein NCU16765 [Neurospora crassa OR74A]KHE80544.1 hypothetical protein GE21DRAFT_5586 [Neurospora crassa]|eukprot:XP_011394375.1 hypothetical protein NCU16765 [Neurospora crassa OR74A]
MDSSQSQAQPQPLFCSPAFPSELLWYIIHHCSYPTTLIVCSSRLEFLTALARDIRQSQEDDDKSQGQEQEEWQSSPQPDQDKIPTDSKQDQKEAQELQREIPWPSNQQQPAATAQSTQDEPTKTTSTTPAAKITPGPWASQLLASPLYQVAVARHIRIVFVPTVSHLRAFLSVFDTNHNSTNTNKVPTPPPPHPSTYNPLPNQQARPQPQQLLLVYGFLALHRDSSEWSVQGLNTTAAVLLETGRRVGLGVVVVEPVWYDESLRSLDDLLGEKMPVVSGSALRGAGGDLERSVGGGLIGRTVDVRRVLGRWFQFGFGEWERERQRDRLFS